MISSSSRGSDSGLAATILELYDLNLSGNVSDFFNSSLSETSVVWLLGSYFLKAVLNYLFFLVPLPDVSLRCNSESCSFG